MKKHLSLIAIATLSLALFFSTADSTHAFLGLDLMEEVVNPLGYAIMKLMSYVAMLGGVALNASIYYTVILMSQNFGDMPAISEAWGVIRDVANMGFIFVLLYASISTIIGRENKARELIVKMVIAAILVNFSLFFTKVVIDISNLLALTFYKALVPASSLASGDFLKAGLSNAMIDALRVSSLFGTSNITGTNLFVTAVLSSVVLLITAFVFFAVAIMFVIRYVILIFVLILSPIAFVSQVLPGLDPIAKQWKEALSGQAIFAPAYFLLTWVTIKLVSGISAKTFENTAAFGAVGSATFDPSIAGTLVNFAVIIGFLVGSLIMSKTLAGKAGAGMNKWATGVAGGLTFGMAGRLGRNTIGRAGQAIADSRLVKENMATSRTARLASVLGKKTGSASFDARATKINEHLEAGEAIGKGGYRQQREADVKMRMDQAKDMTDVVTGDQVEHEMTNRRWASQADQQFLQTLGLSAQQIAGINNGGLSKNQIQALGIDARQAEAIRRRTQGELLDGSRRENARRQEMFIHDLSQTHWYTPNLYTGTSDDAEAARRMRSPEKSPEEKQADAIAKAVEAALAQQQATANPQNPQTPGAQPNPPGNTPPNPQAGNPQHNQGGQGNNWRNAGPRRGNRPPGPSNPTTGGTTGPQTPPTQPTTTPPTTP